MAKQIGTLVNLTILAVVAALCIGWLATHHFVVLMLILAVALLAEHWCVAVMICRRDERIEELESEIQLFNDLGLCVDHTEDHHA